MDFLYLGLLSMYGVALYALAVAMNLDGVTTSQAKLVASLPLLSHIVGFVLLWNSVPTVVTFLFLSVLPVNLLAPSLLCLPGSVRTPGVWFGGMVLRLASIGISGVIGWHFIANGFR